MLVDDDQDDIDLFAEALREVDDQIILVTAYNGQQALDLLLQERAKPDHIFLDINMPIMNGIECLEQLNKRKKFPPPIVTIYSTSGKDSKTYDHCIRLGARFLTKPTSFLGLIKAIQQHILPVSTTSS